MTTIAKLDFALEFSYVTRQQNDAYGRIATRLDGVGTWTYNYHPTSTAPSHPTTTNGAGDLASITGPWTDDTLSYTYDDLGRVINRQIVNGSSSTRNHSVTWAFDKLGRVSKVSNPLAYSTNPTTDFNYAYLGNSDLVDKISALSGTTNGIVRDFDWYSNTQGRFLKQIKHG